MSKARNTRKTKNQPAQKKQVADKKIDRDINDRIALAARGEDAQIVYIGLVVEKALLGEFGSILRALLKGRASMTLNESRVSSKLPAERYLGRLDAYERILDDLEQYVVDKDVSLIKLAEKARTVSGMKAEDIEMHHAPEVGEQTGPGEDA